MESINELHKIVLNELREMYTNHLYVNKLKPSL